jgi:hypothetical protein
MNCIKIGWTYPYWCMYVALFGCIVPKLVYYRTFYVYLRVAEWAEVVFHFMFAYRYLFVRLCVDVQLISICNEILNKSSILVFIGGPKLRF